MRCRSVGAVVVVAVSRVSFPGRCGGQCESWRCAADGGPRVDRAECGGGRANGRLGGPFVRHVGQRQGRSAGVVSGLGVRGAQCVGEIYGGRVEFEYGEDVDVFFFFFFRRLDGIGMAALVVIMLLDAGDVVVNVAAFRKRLFVFKNSLPQGLRGRRAGRRGSHCAYRIDSTGGQWMDLFNNDEFNVISTRHVVHFFSCGRQLFMTAL